MLKFFLTFLFVYCSTTALFFYWLGRALSINPKLRRILFIILMPISVAFVLLYKHSGTSTPELILLQIGAIWFGTFMYTFFISLFYEIAAKLNKKLRTPFIRYRAYLGILSLCFLIALLASFNANNPVLREFTIETESVTGKEEKTYHFAFLSDLHFGRVISADFLEKSLSLLKDKPTDALFFIGDILDDHYRVDSALMKKTIGKINAPLGAWAVFGNHEYISGSIDNSRKLIEESGMKLLVDEYYVLDEKLLLLGRDDVSRTRYDLPPRKSLSEIKNGISKEEDLLPKIVLDHQPVSLADAEKENAIFQISGHTHNGQIWPMNYLINYLYENPNGEILRNNTHSITMKGTGTWGPPIRTTGAPEVWLIKLIIKPKKN